ncbi:hypothetical protein [uncultured Acetatifactor sp.]|uniref:hypothetical protein n=1 Tax=uncultured Acetatifactor sp. TaxID=1671927 RepID=UPI00261446EE|nr:hypothetical protein [uncultured Acetatifactor sp.]
MEAAGIRAGRHLKKRGNRLQGVPESSVICSPEIPRGNGTGYRISNLEIPRGNGTGYRISNLEIPRGNGTGYRISNLEIPRSYNGTGNGGF